MKKLIKLIYLIFTAFLFACTSTNEITKDSSTSTNVYAESQLISAVAKPEEFKEKLNKAEQELKDMKNILENTINNKGKDNRNFIELLNEQRRATAINNLLGNDIKNILENSNDIQKDFSKLIENFGKDLGIEVEVLFTDTKGMPLESKYTDGTARLDGSNGKIYINTDKIKDTSELMGTLFEELSHIIDGVAGRQDKEVAKTTDEKGLESLGRAVNDYFQELYSKDNKAIKLISEGDYTFAEGINVGDKKNEGWDIYKFDIRKEYINEIGFYNEDLNILGVDVKIEGLLSSKEKYTEELIQETLDNTYEDKSYKIDWNKYERDSDYREQTNYYYFQAKHFVKVEKIDKIGTTYVEITQTNGKKLRLDKTPDTESIYHNVEKIDGEIYYNFGENKYKKYVNEDGYELILDKNSNPVYDPLVVGTYNFHTYSSKVLEVKDFIAHSKDITLWKKYGTGPNDSTTKEEREKIGNLLLGKLIQDNYEEIKKVAKSLGKEKLSYNEVMNTIQDLKKIKASDYLN